MSVFFVNLGSSFPFRLLIHWKLIMKFFDLYHLCQQRDKLFSCLYWQVDYVRIIKNYNSFYSASNAQIPILIGDRYECDQLGSSTRIISMRQTICKHSPISSVGRDFRGCSPFIRHSWSRDPFFEGLLDPDRLGRAPRGSAVVLSFLEGLCGSGRYLSNWRVWGGLNWCSGQGLGGGFFWQTWSLLCFALSNTTSVLWDIA
jgi:hypothetical protein